MQEQMPKEHAYYNISGLETIQKSKREKNDEDSWLMFTQRKSLKETTKPTHHDEIQKKELILRSRKEQGSFPTRQRMWG